MMESNNQSVTPGRRAMPGWWLHKIHAYGRPDAYVLARTYYPTSIPKVLR